MVFDYYRRVVGVDIDEDALAQCRANMEELEIEEDDVELLHSNVLTLPQTLTERFQTVVLNPPFGTKNNAGIDISFLQIASKMATGAVYSMHKSSTREHVVKKAQEWGEVQVLAQMKFEILNQFKFHKKERVFVDVDLIRIKIKN
jgi:predicted RNA methylase